MGFGFSRVFWSVDFSLALFAGTSLWDLTLGAKFFHSLHRIEHVIFSCRCRHRCGKWFGLWCGSSIKKTPSRKTCLHPPQSFFCSAYWTGHVCHGRTPGCGSWVGYYVQCPPCKGRLRVFPSWTSPAVGSVDPTNQPNNQPTNQPTKGLIRGGNLREAQVKFPSSV